MATYYVRIDTYWQNSPDRFVGPFQTHQDAENAIAEALDASDSKVCTSNQFASDVKHGIRVHGVMSATAARKAGMKDEFANYGTGNVIDRIPTSTDELYQIENY